MKQYQTRRYRADRRLLILQQAWHFDEMGNPTRIVGDQRLIEEEYHGPQHLREHEAAV